MRTIRQSETIASWLIALFFICSLACSASAQEKSEAPTEEIVANLAAGRVIVAVVKDAIFVATIENPIERDTHPPIPVQLSTDRLGVILGPVEWLSPSSQMEIARLDRDLPQLRSPDVHPAPSLQANQGGGEATDLEVTGDALRARLNDLAQGFHGKIALPAKEPFAELIIADYLGGYGPEVWQLAYQMKQTQDRNDYWNTEIQKPVFAQFWPPEKGAPHTLMEFEYPPDAASQPLLELLKQHDPRVAKIISSDPKMAGVAALFLQGESGKILAVDAEQFLRAVLTALGAPQARETMAMIGEQTGFQWILRPPAEPAKPGVSPAKSRPPGAPTLRPRSDP
jgi:hypothetical protein